MTTKEDHIGAVRTHFPKLSFERAELVTKGWDNDVVILDKTLAFRFPKRPERLGRFQTEVRLLDHFGPLSPLPVPAYTFKPPALVFGGYRFLEGTELGPELLNSFSAAQQFTLHEAWERSSRSCIQPPRPWQHLVSV